MASFEPPGRRLAVLLFVLLAPATARAGGERWIGSISTASVAAPDDRGHMEHFGSGGALSFLWLETCGASRLCGGVEASALFVRGPHQGRLYDLSLGLMGTFSPEEHALAPYLSLGLDMAAASIPDEAGSEPDRGVTLGVHGNVGVHALVNDDVYVRAQVGYIGAGLGGVKGELALGYQF
ncbi:MAG TPA: hypothetical protein VMZ28_27665 [Kofleriaceae bacterium]|nr:hypothetical protein [Kofleriaceae bacterium]